MTAPDSDAMLRERIARHTVRRERLSVSLPSEVVQYARHTAKRLDVSVSAVVADAIRELRDGPAREARNHRIMQERAADAAEDSEP